MMRMRQSTASPRPGVTVRLDPGIHDRIHRIAAAEHRSISAYLQMLIDQDLRARDEAERIVRVYEAPELDGEPPGELIREDGESDERYAERDRVLSHLFGGH